MRRVNQARRALLAKKLQRERAAFFESERRRGVAEAQRLEEALDRLSWAHWKLEIDRARRLYGRAQPLR